MEWNNTEEVVTGAIGLGIGLALAGKVIDDLKDLRGSDYSKKKEGYFRL